MGISLINTNRNQLKLHKEKWNVISGIQTIKAKTLKGNPLSECKKENAK